MAKNPGIHPLHIPEATDRDKDYSRPTFERPPGAMGIYIEINAAEPSDPQAYGSHLYFLRTLTDLFHAQMASVPLDVLKGAFERKNLLDSAIFESYHENNIVSISFENPAGLENLWESHKSDKIKPVIQEIFVTPELLKTLSVKHVKLDARMWRDEYEACKHEVHGKRTQSDYTFENSPSDRDMLKKVKHGQSKLAEVLLVLKDELNRFDQNLGEFIMILKQNAPKSTKTFATVREFEALSKSLKERRDKNLNAKLLDYYGRVMRCLQQTIRAVEDQALHPLLQIHAACENANQRELKRRARKAVKDVKLRLKPDYNVSRLRHAEWQSKILQGEQQLLLGLVSLLPLSVDAMLEVDAHLDEYLSAVQMKKLV